MSAYTRSYLFQRSRERQMEERYSPVEAICAQEKWLADVAVYPAGMNQKLVHARGAGATCLLHPTYAELLSQCSTFKTLEEHLGTFCQGKPVNTRMVQGLYAKLRQLAQQGYLIPRSQINCVFEGAEESARPTRIRTIGIPTCDRVEAAQCCITSYIEHCQRFGRNPDFVVMDDSPSPATQETYRQMLHTLQARYGVNIAYAGSQEKMTFARKLSSVGKIPLEIVFRACVSDKTYGTGTYGANRNALLLHTVGECIFSSDDDIICRVAASPGRKEGLALHSEGEIVHFQYYPDRKRTLEAFPVVEQDILAVHEQWLGQDPLVSGAPYSRAGQLSLEQVTPELLRNLVMQPGKIAMTAHGIIGDIVHNTIDYLLRQSAEELKRQVSTEQTYLTARASREAAQVVNQITLATNAHFPPGAYIGGLDNRELLPPYPPLGRGEDGGFDFMINQCFPDTYTVYLPWVLLHAPSETRSYTEAPIQFPFFRWVLIFMSRFQTQLTGTPADNLLQLGQFLEKIGRLSMPAFEELASHHIWQVEGALASYWENKLCTDEGLPPACKQDIAAHCIKIRQGMLLPIRQRIVGGGPEIVQRLLLQFAEILHWWPAMVETARCLRADGVRLAQSI
jgi:hypothetical protein